ncbi:hypothetical protein F2Q70_00029227 [Brassica cretica]|uniref:Uncharacterized protein n=1 Tax=Brassica cretica TaxID=69181 RepID=A0A8S9FKS2_BRACR|nr:hypothetical protein F2Q70_00029227 [Brassica cretica]
MSEEQVCPWKDNGDDEFEEKRDGLWIQTRAWWCYSPPSVTQPTLLLKSPLNRGHLISDCRLSFQCGEFSCRAQLLLSVVLSARARRLRAP